MQPIFILATVVALSSFSLITTGYLLVRKLTKQLEATTRQLNSALAEHAEVGKRLLSAVDGLPTEAHVSKCTNAAHDGSPLLRRSHVVTFQKR
jgi:hypothetical protein